MNRTQRYLVALVPALALAATAVGTSGCSAITINPDGGGCTITPFVDPTTVTLDHTDPNNEAVFNTGYKYTGSTCAIPQNVVDYYFKVSDPIDATVIGESGVVCVNASAAPITVYSTTMTFSGPTNIPTYTPTNFPTATLTCK